MISLSCLANGTVGWLGAWELRIPFSDSRFEGEGYRNIIDSGEYPLNLILFSGMPQAEWELHYYRSVEEIGTPEKALARWAAS